MTATKPTELTVNYCTCCDARLNPKRTVWLEMNCLTGEVFAEKGKVPASESQGWHPYGSGCARRILKEQRP